MSLVARWPEDLRGSQLRFEDCRNNGESMILGPARTSRSIVRSGTVNAAAAAQAGTGLKINVTYGNTVPAAAQTAFNSVVSTYQNLFNNNVTVNINVNFGNT